jgi:HAD superfamily hydrolase (TIGR01509 family)
MGMVFEWEGVLVGDFSNDHQEAWLQLAEEEGKSPPLAFNLKRAEGMKSEQVVGEVFCWTRNPMDVRRMAQRKLEIFLERLSAKERDSEAREAPPYEVSEGVVPFLESLLRNNIPCAVGCSAPAQLVEDCVQELGLSQYFSAVVTADDVERGRPDPDPYVYAAQALGRVPARCVVIGNSNSAIEAAHEAGMKCVAIQSASKPAYELASADLVVRQLDELSLVNLKQLFRQEDLDALNTMEPGHRHPSFGPSGGYSSSAADYFPEPELQMELEKEAPKRRQYTDFDDW